MNEIPANTTGLTTGVFTGVPAAASYTVKVTDKNGCNVTTASISISNPAAVTATAAVTSNYNGAQVSCNGASDGKITVTATGGTGALSYALNEIPTNVTGLNTGIFTGMPAGASYTVTVTDKNGCNVTTTAVSISNPPAITATATVTSNYNGSQINCNGAIRWCDNRYGSWWNRNIELLQLFSYRAIQPEMPQESLQAFLPGHIR